MPDEVKLVAGAAGIAAVAVLIGYGWPYLLGGFACWLGWRLYVFYREHPATRARAALGRAEELYGRACALQMRRDFPDADSFEREVWQGLVAQLDGKRPSLDLAARILPFITTLYEAEGFTGDIPAPPPDGTAYDLARYQDLVSALIAKFQAPDAEEIAAATLVEALGDFCKSLPALALQTEEELIRAAEQGRLDTLFTVRLLESLDAAGEVAEALILPFYGSRAKAAGLFAGLRDELDRNQHDASGVPYDPIGGPSPKLILPSENKGEPVAFLHAYLKGTPLEALFAAEVPFDIPEETRFEHHWIVAGSGHGKSQTLQYLVARDLEKVASGEASLVVIDSQGDLIRNIAGLKCFAPGEALDGRLCLIDPTDIEYPVALNLFDVGLERLEGYDRLERERLLNGALELYDFVLGSLLSAEMTQKQSVLFRYITRLMLQIPGATIHTFRELLEPGGSERYRSHIEKLDGTARAFFESEFDSKQFEETKRQVVRRLWGILENQSFERMFSHPKSKLDLFAEMNGGKVILINTAKDLLKQTGTEIFGRFFIALIAQVAQERATLPKENRLPSFVYIDECADYLDQNVSLILEQARKFNIGMVLAHQYVGQLSPKLQESFAANTSIKFAGGVSDKDARQLAHMLRTTPDFIEGQGRGQFAASIRHVTDRAVSLRVPLGYLEAMPRMEGEEAEAVRTLMRERYAVHWQAVRLEKAGDGPLPDTPSPSRVNPDTLDTAPSTEW